MTCVPTGRLTAIWRNGEMENPQYLLDTNICISLLKDVYGIRQKVMGVGLSNCYVSEITIAELFYGASKSNRKEERLQDVFEILKIFKVLPIYHSLELYGDVKAHLENSGMRIDDFDLLIGTSAVFADMIMVTGNTRHFARIPDIILENWME